MRYFFLLIFSVVYLNAFSQELAITNKKLLNYYDLINKAEIAIVDNKLTEAEKLYSDAFLLNDKLYAKDVYNEMVVLLKLGKYELAYRNYSLLACLDYSFNSDFINKYFPSKYLKRKIKCQQTLDFNYKKDLDSLFSKDQYYRNISNGNYYNYKKQLTEADSITSATLVKLINKRGFPNEYTIGLGSANKMFFQNFYFIIWHQLATNLYSSQKVNFSQILINALNEGKITPENAAFLLDLNNGKSQFFSKHFAINQFYVGNGSPLSIYHQVKENTAIADCCYVTYGFFPQKRDDFINELLTTLNNNRRKIGLSSIDDQLKKSIFSLNNNDYKFSEMTFEGHQFERELDAKFLKDHMFKIK